MAKRFYEAVIVEGQGKEFVILLDGRVLKTPGKQALSFESKSRADLVATEWRAQGKEIKPETMPCTRLMNVACELTPTRRPELIKEFRSYCSTDLLCFRSQNPKDLRQRQDRIWQPWLDWANASYEIALLVTTSIKAPQQAESALNMASEYAASLDSVRLTLLLHFTASFGSGILALALLDEKLDVDTAYATSRLDEIFQNERWGEDDEATQRVHIIGRELAALAALIKE